MALQIATTPALIGINRALGKLEIQQPKADLNMGIEHPRIEIQTEEIQVQIDQYECFAEAGLKNFMDLTREYAEIGKKAAAQFIDRIVGEGNELADIHNHTNPIPDHAEQNAFHWNDAAFNYDVIPKSRPKIDFIGGIVDIQVIEGKVQFNPQINAPIIRYDPGKLEIYLRQKNSIHIEYIGKGVDRKI